MENYHWEMFLKSRHKRDYIGNQGCLGISCLICILSWLGHRRKVNNGLACLCGSTSALPPRLSYGTTHEVHCLALCINRPEQCSHFLFSSLSLLYSPMHTQQEGKDAPVIVQQGDNVISKGKELHQPGHSKHCPAGPQPLLQQSSHIQDRRDLGEPVSVSDWPLEGAG